MLRLILERTEYWESSSATIPDDIAKSVSARASSIGAAKTGVAGAASNFTCTLHRSVHSLLESRDILPR